MAARAGGSSKTATVTVAASSLERGSKVVAAAAAGPSPARERTSGAVYFWAVVGLAQLALWTNNWARWVPSAEFKRPDPGPYPYMYVLRGTEGLNVALFLFISHHTVVRDGRDLCGCYPLDRELSAPDRNRPGTEMLSTAAVIGWAAAVTVVAYMIPFSWLAMMGDSVPELPSYLQSGIYCGQPGGPLCPGQYLAKLRMELP